jgi:hypothetical protein
MTQIEPGGGQPGLPANPWLARLPAIWVGVVILWSIWGIRQAWPATYAYELPDSVIYFIYAGLIADVVNILWGLALVGLAIARSSGFPRQFVIWQIVNIAWVGLRIVYILVNPDFVLSVVPLIYAAIEIGVGIFMIRLAKNPAAIAVAYSSRTARPSIIVSIIATILGIILGGVVGALAGFGGGALYADLTSMSCFEGACGYFAFFMGLFGIVIGAIAGGILAVALVNRRRSAHRTPGVSN